MTRHGSWLLDLHVVVGFMLQSVVSFQFNRYERVRGVNMRSRLAGTSVSESHTTHHVLICDNSIIGPPQCRRLKRFHVSNPFHFLVKPQVLRKRHVLYRGSASRGHAYDRANRAIRPVVADYVQQLQEHKGHLRGCPAFAVYPACFPLFSGCQPERDTQHVLFV